MHFQMSLVLFIPLQCFLLPSSPTVTLKEQLLKRRKIHFLSGPTSSQGLKDPQVTCGSITMAIQTEDIARITEFQETALLR